MKCAPAIRLYARTKQPKRKKLPNKRGPDPMVATIEEEKN